METVIDVSGLDDVTLEIDATDIKQAQSIVISFMSEHEVHRLIMNESQFMQVVSGMNHIALGIVLRQTSMPKYDGLKCKACGEKIHPHAVDQPFCKYNWKHDPIEGEELWGCMNYDSTKYEGYAEHPEGLSADERVAAHPEVLA